MRKSEVLAYTLVATNAVLQAVQDGTTPDINSWEKWGAALLREVFYEEDQRTHAQDMENLMRQAIGLILTNQDASSVIQQYIDRSQEIEFADGHIVYRPPFDLTTTHY